MTTSGQLLPSAPVAGVSGHPNVTSYPVTGYSVTYCIRTVGLMDLKPVVVVRALHSSSPLGESLPHHSPGS